MFLSAISAATWLRFFANFHYTIIGASSLGGIDSPVDFAAPLAAAAGGRYGGSGAAVARTADAKQTRRILAIAMVSRFHHFLARVKWPASAVNLRPYEIQGRQPGVHASKHFLPLGITQLNFQIAILQRCVSPLQTTYSR